MELTCPKCQRVLGRNAFREATKIYLDGRYEREQVYQVYCHDCLLFGPFAATREKAKQLWPGFCRQWRMNRASSYN